MLNHYKETLTSVNQNFSQILQNNYIANLKEKEILQQNKNQVDC